MARARVWVRSKAIEKRQRILDAAAKMLVAKGYAGATLQDVADEVGMYAASIYYYFPSREELIREVLLESLSRVHVEMTTALDALPEGVSALSRLREAIRSTVRINTSLDDYKIAYIRIIDQAPPALGEELRARRDDIRKLWNSLIVDAKRAGEISESVNPNLLRFAIIGATQWMARWYRPDGGRTPGEIADAFADMMLYGVAPRLEQDRSGSDLPQP